jgi:hypothetical protein
MLSRSLVVAARRLLANPRNVRNISDAAAGLRPMQKTTAFEREILVWSHAFKSIQEIPEWISITKMKKAYDVYRIELNTTVAALFALALLSTVSSEHHKHVDHIHEADPRQWTPTHKQDTFLAVSNDWEDSFIGPF